MRGQNFLPATASPADSERSILIFRGKLELINISVWLFCSTGIISHQPNASLSCSFAPQRLFPPVGCIPVGLFCSTGITLPRSNASLSGSFAPQGLFRPAECISIWLFCAAGIISTGRMHLYRSLLFHRDHFHRSDASLSGSFVPQGLFRPVRYIPIGCVLHDHKFSSQVKFFHPKRMIDISMEASLTISSSIPA